eukprot:SM002446S08201  [mRNA]  locus=s2446:1391:1762:- [translate_table: standard]
MTSLGIRGDRHDVVDFHDCTVAGVAHQTRQGIAEEVVDAHHFWSSGASQHVGGEFSTLCMEAALTLAHPNQAIRWEALRQSRSDVRKASELMLKALATASEVIQSVAPGVAREVSLARLLGLF